MILSTSYCFKVVALDVYNVRVPRIRVGVSLIVESLTVARHQGQLEDECHSQDVLGWTSLPQIPTGRNDSVLLESIHRERQQQDSGISYHNELQSINSSVNKTRSITVSIGLF